MGRRRDEETHRNSTRQYPVTLPYHEGRHGTRYYGDIYPEAYYRDHERYPDDRQQGRSKGLAAIKWTGIVAVALILVFGMVVVTNDFSSGPADSAQQAPQQAQQQAPRQAPQQPHAQQPVPQQPQAPAASSAAQQGGASSEQVEGMRADIERQLAGIRQSINQLRLEIWSLFTSERQEPEQR